MKRLMLLIALIVLIVILVGSSASAVSDAGYSFDSSNIPDNELTNRQTEASNSSASATITITMTGIVSDEER